MPRRLLILFVLVGLVFAATLGWLLANRPGRAGAKASLTGTSSTRSADPLMPDGNCSDLAIPAFTLRDQNGQEITEKALLGRVTVVDFFFTHCKLICPVLTEHMSDLTRTLKGTDVRFLSISVDPEHDTPEVMKAYAADHSADLTRWTFASGDRQTIGNIVTGGMKFAVGEDPNRANAIGLPGGKTMSNIVHPSWFALIGPKGEVLGIYLAEVEQDRIDLAERARKAAARIK